MAKDPDIANPRAGMKNNDTAESDPTEPGDEVSLGDCFMRHICGGQ